MGQRHGATEAVDKFLEDVAEQIHYKPIRDDIKEELAAHIEDRTEEYVFRGMEKSIALDKAIESMGDAVEIGVQLNQIRKVQKNPLTVILIIALLVIGILGNIRAGMISGSEISFSDSMYFFNGITIFLVLYYLGYVNMVKHIRFYFNIIVGTLLLCLIFFIVQGIFELHIYRITNILTILYAWELLSIPVVMVMAYFNRRKKYKAIGLTTVVTAVIIGTSSHFMKDYFLAANLIVLITIYSALLYMIGAGMLEGKIRSQILSWFISLGIVLTVFVLSFDGSWKYELQQCFKPEKVAQNYFDDSYNGILIKDLLGKAKMAGTINISQEELKRYYTSELVF